MKIKISLFFPENSSGFDFIINEEKCNVEVRLLFSVDLELLQATAIFHDDELYKIKCRMFQHGEKMKMCSLKKIFFFEFLVMTKINQFRIKK